MSRILIIAFISIFLFPLISYSEPVIVEITKLETIDGSKYSKGIELSLNNDFELSDLKSSINISPKVKNLKFKKLKNSNIFKITGNFKTDRRYTLKVLEFLVNKNGKNIKKLNSKKLFFTGPGPEMILEKASNGNSIELTGRQFLPLRIQNIERIECTLDKIQPLFAVPFDFSSDTSTIKIINDIRTMENSVDKLSSNPDFQIFSPFYSKEKSASDTHKENFFITRHKGTQNFTLPLSFRENREEGGIFLTDLKGLSGNKNIKKKYAIKLTDIGLLYKFSADSLLLWASSLNKAEPLSEVEILLVNKENDRFYAGKTDKDGILLLDRTEKLKTLNLNNIEIKEKTPKFEDLVGAIVKKDKDYTFVSFNSHRIIYSNITAVDSEKFSEKMSRSTLFTERGIYRPGDVVYFKGAVREFADKKIKAPESGTVEVQVREPGGKRIFRKKYVLSPFGSFNGELKIKKFFKLGQYKITVDGVKLKNMKSFTKTFQVQEFVKPRHYVSIEFKKEKKKIDGYVGTEQETGFLNTVITPQYYSGGPLKHSKIRWQAKLVPANYSAKGYDGYKFGNTGNNETLLETGEALTDGEGKAIISIPLDNTQFNGLSAVKISATSIDIDGRAATGVKIYTPVPVNRIGIGNYPDSFKIGSNFIFNTIVLDENGEKIDSGKIGVKVLKRDWFYSLKRNSSGEVTYTWDQNWVEQFKTELNIVDGKTEFPMSMSDGGNFLIRFTYDNNGIISSSQASINVDWSYYDYYSSREANRNRELLKARQMVVFPTKTTYSNGEEIIFNFNTRRKVSYCLVTVERDGILHYEIMKIYDDKGEFKHECRTEYAPNVYVSFAAISPRTNYPVYSYQVDAGAPHTFYGSRKILVSGEKRGLDIKIASDRTELINSPGEEIKMSINVKDLNNLPIESELSICVVDEAILSLTGFATPDYETLNKFILALSVFSGESRYDLISQDAFKLIHNKKLTGGGGGGSGANLESIKLRKNFNPVAYFNPGIITDSEGNAEFSFKLPDTTTKYRIYAVGMDKKDNFGSAKRFMTVRKEFYIEPSLPQFFVSGDKFRIPLNIFNRSKDSGNAQIKIDTEGSLELEVSGKNVELTPDSRKIEFINGNASKPDLNSYMRFRAKFGEYTDGIEEKRKVFSRRIRDRRFIQGDFSKNEDINLSFLKPLKKLWNEELEAENPQAFLVLSRSPWSRIRPSLKYLMAYPHGCVEQTSSGIIPLVALKKLVVSGLITDLSEKDIDKFINAGISRLTKMHINGSGFSYWPGNSKANFSGTVYALFALVQARNQGYDVPQTVFTDAVKYLRKNTFKNNDLNKHDYPYSFKSFAPYILSLCGSIRKGDMKALYPDVNKLESAANAVYILTSSELGNESPASLKNLIMKNNVLSIIENNKKYNRYRTAALWLMASLKTLDSPNPLQEKIAGYLMRNMGKKGRWISTSDTGLCLLALSEFLRKYKYDENIVPVCNIVSKNGEKKEYEIGESELIIPLDFKTLISDQSLKLNSSSNTLLNYSLELEYPLIESSKENSGKLTIEKEFENLSGEKEIRVGDIVKITLKLHLPQVKGKGWHRDYEYIALSDPLAAGFVAINPAIKANENFSNIEDEKDWYYDDGFYTLRPDFHEFRDDKILVYKDNIWNGWFKYEYYARAVCEGDFFVRPTYVNLMYDPDIFGIASGRNIKILPLKK